LLGFASEDEWFDFDLCQISENQLSRFRPDPVRLRRSSLIAAMSPCQGLWYCVVPHPGLVDPGN
jgi:hypothetical protein